MGSRSVVHVSDDFIRHFHKLVEVDVRPRWLPAHWLTRTASDLAVREALGQQVETAFAHMFDAIASGDSGPCDLKDGTTNAYARSPVDGSLKNIVWRSNDKRGILIGCADADAERIQSYTWHFLGG